MNSVLDLRRLALLLALLPQLFILGLGRGVVVCIAPGGHVQVEAAEGLCCDGGGLATVAGNSSLAPAEDEPDCASCFDIQINLDTGIARDSGSLKTELPAHMAALPQAPRVQPAGAQGAGIFVRVVDRGHEPPHLIHLRSIVLRC